MQIGPDHVGPMMETADMKKLRTMRSLPSYYLQGQIARPESRFLHFPEPRHFKSFKAHLPCPGPLHSKSHLVYIQNLHLILSQETKGHGLIFILQIKELGAISSRILKIYSRNSSGEVVHRGWKAYSRKLRRIKGRDLKQRASMDPLKRQLWSVQFGLRSRSYSEAATRR